MVQWESLNSGSETGPISAPEELEMNGGTISASGLGLSK